MPRSVEDAENLCNCCEKSVKRREIAANCASKSLELNSGHISADIVGARVRGIAKPGRGQKKPRRSGVQSRIVRGGPDGLPRSESVCWVATRGRNPLESPLFRCHIPNLGSGCEKSVKKPQKRLKFFANYCFSSNYLLVARPAISLKGAPARIFMDKNREFKG